MEAAKREERPAGRWFELEPPAPERLELETAPRASTVASYVLTRAAERSWQVLNQHLAAPDGGVFWIGGPAGCGKTHFLDYVIALQKRAGALDLQTTRRLVCGLELAGRVDGSEIERYLLSAMAEQIGGDQRSGDIFRQMRGASAVNVALESARRTGVGAVTVAIDFGLSRFDSVADFFAMLAQVAASFRQVKFTIIAAGRAMAPKAARDLPVAPRDANEESIVAIRRARRLLDDPRLDSGAAYAGIDTAGLAPDAIFPFHPAALNALRTIAAHRGPDGDGSDGDRSGRAAIVSLSRLAREVLASPALSNGSSARLIYPPHLTMNPAVLNLVKALLAEAGRAAWKIAQDRTADLDGYEKDLAREIIDSLIIDKVCGNAGALAIDELKSRLPMIAGGSPADARAVPAFGALLRQLEASTGGVIRLENGGARFDPDAAGAPKVAAFNAALALARRFEPGLTMARDRAGLDAGMKQLDAAMALAVEDAVHTREALESALAEANLKLPLAHREAIATYLVLAESGAAAMLEAAADRSRLASVIQLVDGYEALAAAAAAMPRMREMREYLAGTGLRAAPDEPGVRENSWQQSAIVSLETECELLQVELGPRILTGPPRNLDALEARYQKFKWTYVQCYLSAHSRWCEKMDRLDLLAGDARRHFDALARLNAIAALGMPEGAHLDARVAELSASIVRCELGDSIAPETTTTPRCPSCGFQLGASSPRAGLEDAMESIRRALEIKLAALSQNMIARLIQAHDREHRLEGFLKITQAAQTDALVRVLDEKLARYLARVLEERD